MQAWFGAETHGLALLGQAGQASLEWLEFFREPPRVVRHGAGVPSGKQRARVGHAQVDIHRDTHDVPYQMFRGKCACVSQAQLALRPTHPYRREVGAGVGELRVKLKPREGQPTNGGAAREERAVIGTDNAVAHGERDAAGGVRLAKPQLVRTPGAVPIHPQPIEIQLDTALGQARLQASLDEVWQPSLVQVESRPGGNEQQNDAHPQRPTPPVPPANTVL